MALPELWTKILIFGASNAYGVTDYEGGGWAERLRRFYLEKYNKPEGRVQVVNLSISGFASADLVKQVEPDLAKFSENKRIIAIVAVGLNDSQIIERGRRERPDPEGFRENLVKIISSIKKRTDEIILIGLTPVDESKTRPINWSEDPIHYTTERVKEYDSVVRFLAKKEQLTYIDLLSLLSTSDVKDGAHLKPEGHQKIFERVKEETEKILES